MPQPWGAVHKHTTAPISMQKYTQEIHKDTLNAMARLLEARLLLVECKFALIREGIRPDLVAQIDAINNGFTALKWDDTRATTGKVIDVEVLK